MKPLAALGDIHLPKEIEGVIISNIDGKALYGQMPSRFTQGQIADSALIIALTLDHERRQNPKVTEVTFDFDDQRIMVIRLLEGFCIISLLCPKKIDTRIVDAITNIFVKAFQKVQTTPERVPPQPAPKTDRQETLSQRLAREKAQAPAPKPRSTQPGQDLGPSKPKTSVHYHYKTPAGATFTAKPLAARPQPETPDRPISLIFFHEVNRILLSVVGPSASLVLSAAIKELGFPQTKFPRSMREKFLNVIEKRLPEERQRASFRRQASYISEHY